MKRLALVGLLVAAFWPTAANAAIPCRLHIYNEWYASGKIATTYPISCYRDALKHVTNDAKIYSSLVDDIKAAMQAAVERSHHKQVPAEVGKGNGVRGGGSSSGGKGKHHHGKGGTQTTPSSSTSGTTTTAIGPASGTTGGGGGGIPTPIIILGALAILLALAGGAGTGLRYYRRRGNPPPAV